MKRACLPHGAVFLGATLDTGHQTVATSHAKMLIAIKSHVIAPVAALVGLSVLAAPGLGFGTPCQ